MGRPMTEPLQMTDNKFNEIMKNLVCLALGTYYDNYRIPYILRKLIPYNIRKLICLDNTHPEINVVEKYIWTQVIPTQAKNIESTFCDTFFIEDFNAGNMTVFNNIYLQITHSLTNDIQTVTHCSLSYGRTGSIILMTILWLKLIDAEYDLNTKHDIEYFIKIMVENNFINEYQIKELFDIGTEIKYNLFIRRINLITYTLAINQEENSFPFIYKLWQYTPESDRNNNLVANRIRIPIRKEVGIILYDENHIIQEPITNYFLETDLE